MKVEQDYLRDLLKACQASEHHTFDIEELKAAGFDYDDERFEFHMKILADHGVMQRKPLSTMAYLPLWRPTKVPKQLRRARLIARITTLPEAREGSTYAGVTPPRTGMVILRIHCSCS